MRASCAPKRTTSAAPTSAVVLRKSPLVESVTISTAPPPTLLASDAGVTLVSSNDSCNVITTATELTLKPHVVPLPLLCAVSVKPNAGRPTLSLAASAAASAHTNDALP